LILTTLELTPAAFEAGTGWAITPRGACNGDLCVPLPDQGADTLSVAAVADRLGMPLVHDAEQGLWALGPASPGGRALLSAEAPELELPDVDGRPFTLSSLRGQKVLLVAWAPY
jgi:hypothetical protein